MKKAFEKSVFVIEFRNQFLSMERFRACFEKLDSMFLELSEFYKKSSYTKIVSAWLSGYIEELNHLHETKLKELIETFKDTIQFKAKEVVGVEVDSQFERVQNEVEDDLIEVTETLMCHSMNAESQKICLQMVDEYIGKIFQFNRLIIEDNEVVKLGGDNRGFVKNFKGRVGNGIKDRFKKVKKVAKVKRVRKNIDDSGVRDLRLRIQGLSSIGKSPVKSRIARLGDDSAVKAQGPKIDAKIHNFAIEDLGNNYVVSLDII